MIKLSPQLLATNNPRLIARVIAHEVTHVVQEQILGEDAKNILGYYEGQSWGDSRYIVPDELAKTPIGQINPVSGNYSLETLAARFGNEVWNTWK